ncbi:MAG: CDP-diacylglycerol--glycerol-3-phosphate 3-phosphatidyltransferase [Planctomyces sp.]|jgi:CDP-diacylglycerol--glycerol-3-phosphate 3-phosphatidyltransferase
MSSDTSSQSAAASRRVFGRESLNLPNLITLSRLILAFLLFALIAAGGWWITSAVLFVFAATTDALDGYLARRYGQITVLGRILDPFVDKIIVCGTFIFLMKPPGDLDAGVSAWMVTTIIGREMFVSTLRGLLEKEGKDFSASFSGKAKMALQCVAVTLCLASLSPALNELPMFLTLRSVVLIAAVIVTVWSGLIYVFRGAALLQE